MGVVSGGVQELERWRARRKSLGEVVAQRPRQEKGRPTPLAGTFQVGAARCAALDGRPGSVKDEEGGLVVTFEDLLRDKSLFGVVGLGDDDGRRRSGVSRWSHVCI